VKTAAGMSSHQAPGDMYDNIWIEADLGDGKRAKRRVNKEFLDLTDIQNRDFQYVL
jgi:MFS transporter, ACS family, allantoate permease